MVKTTRFELEPLRLSRSFHCTKKALYILLLLVLQVWSVKIICRKSWTVNHMLPLDLTFGPSASVVGYENLAGL